MYTIYAIKNNNKILKIGYTSERLSVRRAKTVYAIERGQRDTGLLPILNNLNWVSIGHVDTETEARTAKNYYVDLLRTSVQAGGYNINRNNQNVDFAFVIKHKTTRI